MAFKHYDVVRAAPPSDLAEKLTHKLKEGWQPFGSPVAITPYTLRCTGNSGHYHLFFFKQPSDDIFP
ncbi:DUF1737 domain-containing protein [Shigella sonnei]|nr:DUF1737 domain-containing protein [Shigella sonnei]MBK3513493.1 DUF1737 domain-containing protein [Shigella sonnei]